MIASEKIKELREWATLVLSALTVIAIPGALLILHNQRLEIMADVSRNYVPMTTYKEDAAKQAQSYGEIKGQLTAVLIEQVHLSDNLNAFKDQFNLRTKP